jgi:hypothetical protein
MTYPPLLSWVSTNFSIPKKQQIFINLHKSSTSKALSHIFTSPLCDFRKDQLQQDYNEAKAAQNLATRDFAALMRSKTGEGRSLQAPGGVLEVQVVI